MIIPRQHIERAIFGQVPMIRSDPKFKITPEQIQPASFDFRLGTIGYRMRSAALPNNETVAELIAKYKKYDFPLDTEHSHYLERGMTYLIPLLEGLALPAETSVDYSTKSSIGRCDVFTRLMADKVNGYNEVPAGYHGPLYLEVTPLSHDVMVKTGLSLVQGRFKTSETRKVSGRELQELHMQRAVLFSSGGEPLDVNKLDIVGNELYFHIDLNREVVGFVAKDTTLPINLSGKEEHEPYDFWEPIRRPKSGMLELLPGKFYLLATKERARIPAEICGQVQDYKTNSGEMRPHYAGFFDNGFGGEQGTNGVLEVRAREVTMRVVDGQRICAMAFERTTEIPNQLYGAGSSYTGTGPSLSKHFKHRYDVWYTGYWAQW
jgi:dCTP deaminase